MPVDQTKSATTPREAHVPRITDRPLFLQIAALLRQRIKQGDYPPGGVLPPIRQLSQELGLSHNAVQRAVQSLTAEGVIESKHGIGTRVVDPDNCEQTALLFGFIQPFTGGFSVAIQEFVERSLEGRANLCVFRTSDDDAERERSIIEHLVANGVNGLILWPVAEETNREYLAEVSTHTPLVVIDRRVEGLRVPTVIPVHDVLGRQVVDTLVGEGRRRLLVVLEASPISPYRDLEAGLRAAADRHGNAIQVEIDRQHVVRLIHACARSDWTEADAMYEYYRRRISEGGFDAFMCPQDEFHRRVFFDDNREAALDEVQLLSVRPKDSPRPYRRFSRHNTLMWEIDQRRLVGEAMQRLEEMMSGSRPSRREVRVPFDLEHIRP